MIRLTIHQFAEREAYRAAAGISDQKLARGGLRAAYDRGVTRLAQEVASGRRPAWIGASADYSPVSADHPLWLELADWLKNGRRVTHHKGQSGNVLSGKQLIPAFTEVRNEGWIKGLFIAADPVGSNEAASAGVTTYATGGPNQSGIPDQWGRGLKRVAWECARAIVAEGKKLTGPALWDAIAADSRVKIREQKTAEYKSADPSMIGGEVSATIETIRKDWRKQLDSLIRANSG